MSSLHLSARVLLLAGGLIVLDGSSISPALAQSQPTATTPASGEAEGYLDEPGVITKAIDLAVRSMPGGDGGTKNGLFIDASTRVSGAGWVSGGPGYRHWLFDDEAVIEASGTYSWRGYKTAQARFELPQLFRSRFGLGTQYRWQDLTQVSYFGEGADSLQDARSEYRLRSHNWSTYAIVRPTRWLALQGRAGMLGRPWLSAPAGHFNRGFPSVMETFPNDVALMRDEQPGFLHADVSLLADTRDQRNHPVHGGVYRASWATYRDRDDGLFSFRRFEAEAAQFVPLAGDRIVLALHGWSVLTGTDAGHVVPFYFTPSLGGSNTLRSFNSYRFHDRHMAVVNAEARLAIFTHLDGALFVDAGNVAARARDLNLNKTSYGVGVRLHTNRATFARIDVAHGREGWRAVVRLNDPLRLSRLSMRAALLPFVP